MEFVWKYHGNFSWKNSNDISYETTKPILLKFNTKHLYDFYINLS